MSLDTVIALANTYLSLATNAGGPAAVTKIDECEECGDFTFSVEGYDASVVFDTEYGVFFVFSGSEQEDDEDDMLYFDADEYVEAAIALLALNFHQDLVEASQ